MRRWNRRRCAAMKSLFLRAAACVLAALLAGCAGPVPSERVASRPGLGTGWGETRDSQTVAGSFTRARGNRPAARDQTFYDDLAGLRAMLDVCSYPVRQISGLDLAPGGLVSWGLQGSGARWLRGYEIEGRRVLAGEKGERYQVVIRNETDRRLEAVVSVDGLDVMDGRPASLAGRGYILRPRQTLRVQGFRTSEDTVAAFRFSSVGRSYAALKHGDTRNVGVIGLAVFEEKRGRWAEPPGPWRTGDLSRRQRAEPFPGR
jgi:hypothetical protein